ncbi:hypothetical protein [Echinicola sp. 20G]|uniref:hypothetical protein n=1 Tax=Echinicola sp. 20G TaxID=2781961 RepID=UPI0019107316|nr:hypothetical protein [Echinicola sp. 20G]
MEEQVKALLEKYYEGETSLEEEKLIKELLREVEGFEDEKMFFLGLSAFRREEPTKKPAPKAERSLGVWQRVAAVVLVFLVFGWLFIEQQRRMEEEEAYEKVVEALAMIQKNMKKGTSSLQVMDDMKYLNTTNDLFNIKEIKEEEK